MLYQNHKPTIEEIDYLSKNGFNHISTIHDWIFSKDGYMFDLSAADLTDIKTIFEKKLFVANVDVM